MPHRDYPKSGQRAAKNKAKMGAYASGLRKGKKRKSSASNQGGGSIGGGSAG